MSPPSSSAAAAKAAASNVKKNLKRGKPISAPKKRERSSARTNETDTGSESENEQQYGNMLPLESVVKIFCVHAYPNFSLPWQMRRQCKSTGSGFVIAGKRILTNSHCVEYGSQVQVKRRGSDSKYLANIVALGHECDLALLEVEDDAFWKEMKPCKFARRVRSLLDLPAYILKKILFGWFHKKYFFKRT